MTAHSRDHLNSKESDSATKRDLFTRSKNGDIVVYDSYCDIFSVNDDDDDTEIIDCYL